MPSTTSTRFFVVFCILLVLITSLLIVNSPALAQASDPPVSVETPDIWSALIQSLAFHFGPWLVGALAAWALPKLIEAWVMLKANKPDVASAITGAASLAIHAAEQAGAAKYIGDKKEYAMAVAEKWLKTKGITVDLDLIDAAVEAAVHTEINQWKSLEGDEAEG